MAAAFGDECVIRGLVGQGKSHRLIKVYDSDYRPLTNEDEAVQQRFKSGPVGFVTVHPIGMPPIG